MRSGTTALGALLLIVLGPATALAAKTTVHLSMPSTADPAQLSISSLITMYQTDDSGALLTGDTLLNGGPIGGLNLLDRIGSPGSYVPITTYYVDVSLPNVAADSTVGSGYTGITPWIATTGPDGLGGTLIEFQATGGSAPLEGGLYMADLTADSTDPAFPSAHIVLTGTPTPEFSTVAMMIAGSMGVFGSRLARLRRRGSG